eukprot:2082326-Amphidinium_carterae.2
MPTLTTRQPQRDGDQPTQGMLSENGKQLCRDLVVKNNSERPKKVVEAAADIVEPASRAHSCCGGDAHESHLKRAAC